MPEMIPVANQIQPPNAGQTLSNLSSIYGIQQQQLGLQQQRQALQTGQYQQATAQAVSQQEQQKNQELQGLGQFAENAMHDPKYFMEDGVTPNIAKFQQDATTVGGVYGAPVVGQLTSNFKEAAETRRTLQNLAKEQNETITGGLKGLANLPGGATRSDVLNWIDQVTSNNKDPGMRRALDNALIGMQPDENGSYSGVAAKMAATLGGLSMQEPGTQQLGGVQQPITTTTMGPNIGQQTPVGAPVKTVTPATNTTNAAGQIIHVPTGGAGLPSTASPPGVAPNVNPSNAAAGAQVDDNTRYKQISDTAQMSQTGENLARNVAHLATGLRTGKFSGEVTDWLTTIRQNDPGLTDRQLLSKYAAQLQNTALQASGGDTDLSRGVVLHGMPNPDNMNPGAIEDASRYIGGLFSMSGARSKVASDYVRSHGGSPVGLRSNVDEDFMRHANPDVFTYMQMSPGKERRDWLKRHGYSDPQTNAQLRRQLQVMSQYGVQ